MCVSSVAEDILTLGEEILSKEPSLLELEGPITLCGSILGDLPHLQSIWMAHADGGLLFLGDYQKDSDSGAHDVEARRDFNHRCTFETLITNSLSVSATAFQAYGWPDMFLSD